MLWIQIKLSCNLNNLIQKYLNPTSTAIVQSPCSWTRKTCLRKRYWSRHWRTTLKSEITIVTINNINHYQIHYHQHICHCYHLEGWSPTDEISEPFLKQQNQNWLYHWSGEAPQRKLVQMVIQPFPLNQTFLQLCYLTSWTWIMNIPLAQVQELHRVQMLW